MGLLSFFISEERGYGALRSSEAERRHLAEQSAETNAQSAPRT